MNFSDRDVARFRSHLRPNDGGCVEWTSNRSKYGYGRFVLTRQGRKTWVHAHRAAWVIQNGPIPDDLVVRHFVCANRLCCNPSHLAIGTQQDNAADRERDGHTARGNRHGRHTMPGRTSRGVRHGDPTRGERNGCAKLTESAVRSIRADAAIGRAARDLAAAHGVSVRAVTLLLSRKTWSHVS